MKLLGRIVALSFRHKWWLVGAYVCLAGTSTAQLVLPWLFGEAIDRIYELIQGGSVSDQTMLTIAAMILGAGIVQGVLGFGQMFLGQVLSEAVVYDLRNTFYDRVQRLSFGFHDRQHTGNLMSRAITDVEAMRMFVVGGIIRAPYFIFLVVGAAFVMVRLDWQLGLLAIGFVPIGAIVSTKLRVRLGRLWRSSMEDMAELSTVLQENLTGVRVIKAFASEEYEERRFEAKNTDVAGTMVRILRAQAMMMQSLTFAFFVAMGLILWYGGYRTINGNLSPGELAQFLFYMQVLAMPVRQSGMMINSFVRAISAGQRLFEIIDAPSPVQESGSAVEMPRAVGHVRLESVSFSYEQGVEVLKNIDLEVLQGQVVALLGAPGSGKSTVVHLLPRFYDVNSGRVTIDGMDVRDATLASLRRNIGIVQQDVFLFTASIRDNIAYGREGASMEEVEQAARVAQLHDYIESLDKGYETVIGERGSTLSGGQRQRLSIARAVLLDPPVLVLDDSTSSVDASTEEEIRKAMESVMRGRTTFVIAHRLSTVHRADQILVLKDGEITERGTHSDLLETGGLYREIYDLQLRPQEEVMLEFDLRETAREDV